MRPITMRFGPTFRSGRMRPADGPSNGSATLSRIRSLADYTIAMLESSFRKRQVAIFTDQDLREQRRSRQATGDGPLWRRRLTHRSAGATAVFGSANADDTQLRGHPIQHLADAL